MGNVFRRQNQRNRMLWFFLYFFMLLCLARLFVLHIFPDERAIARATQQYWSYVELSSKRGVITDCRNVPLAVSVSSTSFYIDPQEWETANAPQLEKYLPEKIFQKISKENKGRFLWILRKVPPRKAEEISALQLPGLYSAKEGKRTYPQGTDVSHVLGFCDIDEKGLTGIELMFDSFLYSPPERHIIAKTGRGTVASTLSPETYMTLREPGAVHLTIDARIQHILSREIARTAKQEKARWAAGLCMDVKSGAIRGMVSWPFFDANSRESLRDKEALRNNAIGRVYEPGSTMKPIILGMALEMGRVGWNETFFCPGKIHIADGWISEIFGHGYGKLSPKDIIRKSSNVGMAQIGLRIKPQDGYDYLRFWGFGLRTGIEFSGEERGLLHKPEQWLGVVPSNIAIGQGVAVTPLQLITAVSAIANGGTLYQPYIVDFVESRKGIVDYQGIPHARNAVLTKKTTERLQEAMASVVENGSGRAAKIPGISIAGKTGTAQIAHGGSYAENSYVASFVGFWPVEDPVLALLVVVGEPGAGKTQGGQVAAPAFRRMVEKIAVLEPEYGAQTALSLER